MSCMLFPQRVLVRKDIAERSSVAKHSVPDPNVDAAQPYGMVGNGWNAGSCRNLSESSFTTVSSASVVSIALSVRFLP